jgi:hypothetical protein
MLNLLISQIRKKGEMKEQLLFLAERIDLIAKEFNAYTKDMD